MSHDLHIRPATPGDLHTIVMHRHRMFEDMGHAGEAVLEAAKPLYTTWLQERLANGRYLGWLAETPEGTVVAGAGLWLLDWPAGILDIGTYRGYLFNVYTEPAYRKQGIARRLVAAALDHCTAQGIRVVGLHASKEGRSIYEALGFAPTNEMRLILPEGPPL